MNNGSNRLHHLLHVDAATAPVGLADGDLLSQFISHRDEVAFELLVRRHAPMVLGVCRRLLVDPNDADDVFQATFLVLARKASSITRGDVLAAWLHRVAFRAAIRVRSARVKRLVRREEGIDQIPSRSEPSEAWAELCRVLDEEILRLPKRQRVAFVLCCIEGKTGEEAARLLKCPPGTVSSRLTRARAHLRERLTRRGFAPAALLLAGLKGGEVIAAAPAALIDSTMRISFTHDAGSLPACPSRPVIIAEGVIRAMYLTKLRFLPLICLVSLFAVGAVLAGSGQRPQLASEPLSSGKQSVTGKVQPEKPMVRVVHPSVDRIWVIQTVAEPARVAQVHPLVAGVLTKVQVDVGDSVKAGQVLAQISAPALILDQRTAAIGVAQARGLLKEVEARLGTAEAEVKTAEATVRQRETELAGAKKSLAHHKQQLQLYANQAGVIDKKTIMDAENLVQTAASQVDSAAMAIEVAKLNLDVKRAQGKQGEAGVETAKANLEAAQIAFDKSKLNTAQTTVVAPVDGIVSRCSAVTGDFALAGVPASSGPLFTIIQPGVLRLGVYVPEYLASAARVGLEADVTVDALPGRHFAGKLVRLSVELDSTNHRLNGQVEIPNPKGEIRPGMQAHASLNLGKGPANTVYVPDVAVFRDKQGPGDFSAVYLYRDGKARLVRVKLGALTNGRFEVTEGLKPEDQVIVNPQVVVADNVPVEVEKKETSK